LIGKDDLPAQFTWENFEGFNFVGDIADQGSCGSCYVVASTTMLESRIMLYYGEKNDLSSQFPLQCNFMNEGCHGGWGIFNGIFLENYYTCERNEAPYKA
jgi:cathepsin C